MKLIVSADKHIREETPYRAAINKFIDWFVSRPFNSPDNIFIDLGDLYHKAKPTPNEYADGHSFLNRIKGQKKLLAGNHDYDYSDEHVFFSLQPHYQDKNVEIITEPVIHQYGNVRCLFLPWVYLPEGHSRKDFYENIFPKKIENQPDVDFIFYHFCDETVAFGGRSSSKGIDLSKYKGKRVGGDIHVTVSDNYLQVPIPTRKDEAGHSGEILVIDTETKEIEYYSVPRFLDFYVIHYGEEPQKNPEGEAVHYILDAPSFEAAEEKYSHINLGGVSLKKYSIQSETTENSETDTLSTDELTERFFEEKKVDPEVQAAVRRAFSKNPTI